MKAALALGISLIALLSPTASAAKVEVAHDPSVDFSRFSTYAWIEGAPAGKPEVERWLVRAIEHELDARGLTKVDPEHADLHVKKLVMTLVNMSLFTNYIASSTGGWGFWQANTRAYGDGAVVVDLIDPDMDKLVWRSIASGTVTGPWQKLEGKIPKVARKMFKDFPPYFVP